MGNQENCFFGGGASRLSKSEVEEKALVEYIASYKPGRKLNFRNSHYDEGNAVMKLEVKEIVVTQQRDEQTPNNQHIIKENKEEEEIKMDWG